MTRPTSIKCLLLICLSGNMLLTACRQEEPVIPPVVTPVDTPVHKTVVKGFYLLNEGNMGSNKATLDYYDYLTGNYKKNIYAEANPNVVKEMGDVGNDIQIYGNKLFAVINVSNKVDVLDVATAKHLGEISVLNCRYVTFHKGKAYISAYAGPVKIDTKAPIGIVVEVDTATLQITRKVEVGYQPEEMAIINGKLYVANSGGYRVPNYDSTVSVIDLNTFKEIKKIDVAINLHRLKADQYGDIYVTSRGDYQEVPSRLFLIDTKTDLVKKQFDIAASNLCIVSDTAYIYGSEFNYNTFKWTISYNMVDVKQETVIGKNYITDGTTDKIKLPYGIAVNPITREIFLTDAKGFTAPGTLYSFTKDGKQKWSVTTGDIPAHFAFVLGEE